MNLQMGGSTSDQFEWMYACCHSVLCLKPFSLYCLDCEMIDFSINNLLVNLLLIFHAHGYLAMLSMLAILDSEGLSL